MGLAPSGVVVGVYAARVSSIEGGVEVGNMIGLSCIANGSTGCSYGSRKLGVGVCGTPHRDGEDGAQADKVSKKSMKIAKVRYI